MLCSQSTESATAVQDKVATVDKHFVSIIAKKDLEINQLRRVLGKQADSIVQTDLTFMKDAAEITYLKAKSDDTRSRLAATNDKVQQKCSALLRAMVALAAQEETIVKLNKNLKDMNNKLVHAIAVSMRRADELAQARDLLSTKTHCVEHLTTSLNSKGQELLVLKKQLERQSDELQYSTKQISTTLPTCRLSMSPCQTMDIEPSSTSALRQLREHSPDAFSGAAREPVDVDRDAMPTCVDDKSSVVMVAPQISSGCDNTAKVITTGIAQLLSVRDIRIDAETAGASPMSLVVNSRDPKADFHNLAAQTVIAVSYSPCESLPET